MTIHHLDEGIDTGDIIIQREVVFKNAQETLATTYAQLQEAIQQLFMENWVNIKSGKYPRTPQQGQGSVHKVSDKDRYEPLLTNRWNTPVSALINKAFGK